MSGGGIYSTKFREKAMPPKKLPTMSNVSIAKLVRLVSFIVSIVPISSPPISFVNL